MSESNINKITESIKNLFKYDAVDMLAKPTNEDVVKLLDIIASLHNELYNEVTGEYYDYMFHWANKGYCGDPNDSLFKEN